MWVISNPPLAGGSILATTELAIADLERADYNARAKTGAAAVSRGGELKTRAAQTKPASLAAVRAAREMQPYAERAADFLKAMANDQRLMILCHLIEGPLSVSEINSRVTLSQSALSQHLAVLREARIVATEKQSQTVFYSLAPGPVVPIIKVLHEEFCRIPASR